MNLSLFKQNKIIDDFLGNTILIVAGLALPVVLIPIVKLIGFTEIIEEISKALLVYFLIYKMSSLKQKIAAGLIFGFLFGLSENLLYLNNIYQLGDFGIFWQRFFLTGSMHIITVLVIVFSGLKYKKNIIWGLLAAIVTHLLFNHFI